MDQASVLTPAPETARAYTYFAFISYKREDEKWARWLKRQLQGYRLPAKTHKRHPDLPRRCSPVFLDKSNLTPGLLDEGLRKEVQSSKYIIVICSRTAHDESRYLDDELRYFLESGDRSRVIPFIVDESDDPVAECFPAALAELCAERNIVGVSVHDDGKRLAMLKVVATMHGLKLEELESEDMRRRKKQLFAAAVLALLLAVGGRWIITNYYDIAVEDEYDTAYYRDYLEVLGVPVGIGELSDSEVTRMSSHYAIVSRGGVVIELRYEGPDGGPLMQHQLGRIERFAKAEYTYENDKLSVVKRYDAIGHLIAELHYISENTVELVKAEETEEDVYFGVSPLSSRVAANITSNQVQAQKSNVSRQLVFYDSSGYTSEIHYCSDKLNSPARDADGISGIRYERDELGRITMLLYLSLVGDDSSETAFTDKYEVIEKSSGEAGVKFTYDGSGNVDKVRFIGANGEPVLHKNGCAGLERSYDECGNIVITHYFDMNDKPVLISYGYSAYYCSYDEHGREVEIFYCGTDGMPILCVDGYAIWRRKFNDFGNVIKVSYFDTDGEPVITAYGNAGWEAFYDNRGNLTGFILYDENGEPIRNTN